MASGIALPSFARSARIARYKRAGLLAWARRQEREEAVTGNIAPELLPLWNRVGRSLAGTPAERLAAFDQYAHDHADEVLEAQMGAAEDKLETMLRDREASDRAASAAPF